MTGSQVTKAMRVAVTGASGLIGSRVHAMLEDRGHQAEAVRRGDGDGLRWDPGTGLLDRRDWEGLDGVVHLAGEPIDQRWTQRARQRIWDSRVPATRRLCEGLAALDEPPSVLVCANAVGFYGDQREPTAEDAPPGDGFLAEVCAAWQEACDPAREAGIRVANIRTGIVLARGGGALPRMLLPFRLGLGGPIGSGRQHWPWIHIDDEARAVLHVLGSDVEGPVNLVAPEVVEQRRFANVLGRVLRRPAFMPLPGFALRLMFGEMGRQTILFGQNLRPGVLEKSGFTFTQPGLEGALRDVLDRPATAK